MRQTRRSRRFREVDAANQVLVGAIRDTPDSQAALALQLSVDTSTMVRLIDDLEYAGLVERRIDPADRRRRHLVATDRGRRLDASVRAKIQLAEDHVLRCLESKERETFREMLGRLTSRAGKADVTRGTAGTAGTRCTNPDRRSTPLDHPQIRGRRRPGHGVSVSH
jgi:MarR family transcriptional regulator for hemolysin